MEEKLNRQNYTQVHFYTVILSRYVNVHTVSMDFKQALQGVALAQL